MPGKMRPAKRYHSGAKKKKAVKKPKRVHTGKVVKAKGAHPMPAKLMGEIKKANQAIQKAMRYMEK